jgi:hypothetical protein
MVETVGRPLDGFENAPQIFYQDVRRQRLDLDHGPQRRRDRAALRLRQLRDQPVIGLVLLRVRVELLGRVLGVHRHAVHRQLLGAECLAQLLDLGQFALADGAPGRHGREHPHASLRGDRGVARQGQRRGARGGRGLRAVGGRDPAGAARVGLALERSAVGRRARILVGGHQLSGAHVAQLLHRAARPLDAQAFGAGARTDADQHGRRVLRREAVAAAVLARQRHAVAEVHQRLGAVAVAGCEFGRGCRTVAADEAHRDEVAGRRSADLAEAVAVELQEGRVRGDHREVGPAVAVVVERRGDAAVVLVVQA